MYRLPRLQEIVVLEATANMIVPHAVPKQSTKQKSHVHSQNIGTHGSNLLSPFKTYFLPNITNKEWLAQCLVLRTFCCFFSIFFIVSVMRNYSSNLGHDHNKINISLHCHRQLISCLWHCPL